MASRSSGGGRSSGPSRYQRSSTASMTQLLSDSCSSLLHRLTSRVRGPSASVDSPSSSSSSRGVGASAGLSLSTLGLSPLAPLSTPSWNAPAAAAHDRTKDRDRARDRDPRDNRDHDIGRPRSPTFTTFGQTRSRLEKKYGQKKTTSPPPSPVARRSAQRGRHSKPRAAGAAARKDGKDASPLLGVSKVRHTDHYGARTPSSPQPELGSTRSRLEDKYSAILAKYGREPRDKERTAERRAAGLAHGDRHGDRRSPQPLPLALSKSATTAIVLSEKAYPYVSSPAAGPAREKTPYRCGDHARRSRQRSGHRHPAAPPRLCPVEFDVDAVDAVDAVAAPRPRVMSPGEREALMLVAAEEKRERERELQRERERERPSSPATNEREARRKEIQSLIAKYTTAVNDRLQRREQREQRECKEKEKAAAAAAAAAGTATTPAARSANYKADSGTLTPTRGAGRATTTVGNSLVALAPLGHGPGLGHGLGPGAGPAGPAPAGHGKWAGSGLAPGLGHSLGKSASGVFSPTHSDSGALHKSQSKYSMLSRRPMASSSATSLALPNFSFVRSVLRALRDSMGPVLAAAAPSPNALPCPSLRAACGLLTD